MKENNLINKELLTKTYSILTTAMAMTELYEENKAVTSKYVHATSRGHELLQIALGLQLNPQDYAYLYYRDDSTLLSIGMEPYQLMLQLLCKMDDPFSGGRTYYSHPSLKDADKPKIPHQSSATGMQAIPATGSALGMQYKEIMKLMENGEELPVTVCSIGDASMTEGEVSEALQIAALKQLPILYFVQDNEWDISAYKTEVRAQNAYEFSKGFKGIEAVSFDGTDFETAYTTLNRVLNTIRKERRPFLVHAEVPLLNHHTSGVRMEWYRDDLDEARSRDPYPKFKKYLLENGFSESELDEIEKNSQKKVKEDYAKAVKAKDPEPADLFTHDFAPTEITEEQGNRESNTKEKTLMVDCALFAVEELMKKHPECVFYGQDVGGRLGGVFREAATLAQKFGDHRVFNTPIQEAFIIGSTVGMSAVGLKPIVEVQFADYIWPGLNQLFTEVSRSSYLSNGKWPVSMILRVPIGAYGSGGPYHSSSVESIVASIRGLKVVYPSNGADLKGLMKAAYYDPNPVVIFEHKGLYWSKLPGTKRAAVKIPDEDYIVPIGKAKVVNEIWKQEREETATIISYGMGVHWALEAIEKLDLTDRVEVVDLRSIHPLDYDTVFESVKKAGKCLVVTEESIENSFARALAGKIQEECFQSLDAPVMTIGSENIPAIPLNETLEKTMIPNIDKVADKLQKLLDY